MNSNMLRVLYLTLAALIGLMAPVLALSETPARVIRSAAEYDYPPLCFVDDTGHATGFAVELLKAVVRVMGHDIDFRVGPWPEVKASLVTGAVDVLPLVGRTPEREPVFDFTFPYLSLHGTIVVRKGTREIRDFGDLSGLDVAVLKGDNAEEYLRRNNPGCRIHTTDSFETALKELSRGSHDAVVIQRLLALRLIADAGLTNLELTGKSLKDFRQDFCLAVTEGDREILAMLNEGLALVMADGTFQNLQARWLAVLNPREDKRIVIGGDQNFPPYEFLDEKGQPAGYNVDLTRAIARITGLDIDIRLGPWTDIRKGLSEGHIDAIQGMFYTDEREQTLDFSPPHSTIQYVVVVPRRLGPVPSTWEDLSGKRIVVMKDDVVHDVAGKKIDRSRITGVQTQEMAMMELCMGKHDCALVSRVPALYWIQKNGWKDLAVGDKPLLNPEYCYAVSERNLLKARLSEGLKILTETGEYHRIHAKWLGPYEKPGKEILYSVAGGVGLLFLGFLLVVAWSWSLRRTVTIRTSELNESRMLLENFFTHSPAPVALFDSVDRYLKVNPVIGNILNRPEHEIFNRPFDEILPPDTARAFQNRLQTVMDTGRSETVEDIILMDGSSRVYQTVIFPLPEDGARRRIGCIATDITERKRAEENLLFQISFSQAILDSMYAHLAVLDRGGNILMVNRAWCRFAAENGAADQTTWGVGTNYYQACSKEAGGDSTGLRAMEGIREVQAGRVSEFSLEYPCHSPTRERWFVMRVLPLLDRTGEVLISHSDITARYQAETAMRKSLKEKNVLLQEIHHRVKNNLQIVASLMGLQASRSGNPEVTAMLQDTRNRIRSMSLLHETLYRSDNFAGLNLQTYVAQLCAEIMASVGTGTPRIRLEHRIAAIDLPLDLAVPFGLIISELVSNSVKYAFPGNRSGQILVALEPGDPDENLLMLTVSDDGVGLPENFDPEQTTSLGLQLVHNLAIQMGGSLSVSGGETGGVRVVVSFPRADVHFDRSQYAIEYPSPQPSPAGRGS